MATDATTLNTATPVTTSSGTTGTSGSTSSSIQQEMQTITDQYAQNFALTTLTGELNEQQGFATSIAQAKEAVATSAKDRTEAAKQLS